MNTSMILAQPVGTSAAAALLGGTGAPAVGGAMMAGATTGSPVGATAASTDNPSTAGFLQVLDLLLSNASISPNGSQAVADLFTPTTSFKSTDSMAGVQTSSTDTEGDDSDPSIDPNLCSAIASLLQAMGFQVRPEQIAQLQPLDQQQLGSALEFAERNLARGVPVQDVAENMSLLLPRSWPLDTLDGSPAAATATATPTNAATDAAALPAGFVASLESAREKLTQAGRHEAVPPSEEKKTAGVSSAQATAVDPTASPAAVTASSSTGSKQPTKDQTGSKKESPDPAIVAVQQESLSRPASVEETAPRKLVPGGTTSEFIGRQVLEKIHVQLSEGRKELSLRLWPEELGEVRLSLRMDEGSKVQAHMVVENESVRQAMLDSMPQLREALVKHGMDLEKMSVSVGQKDSGSTGSGSASGDRDGEGRKQGGGGRGQGSREADLDVAVPMVLGRDTGRRDGRNTFELWS
jgi:flagellar hook-length control protein FliK